MSLAKPGPYEHRSILHLLDALSKRSKGCSAWHSPKPDVRLLRISRVAARGLPTPSGLLDGGPLRLARRIVQSALTACEARLDAAPLAAREPDAEIGAEARWFRCRGVAPVDLSRRRALRLLLLTLAENRVAKIDAGLSLDTLLEAVAR